MKNHVVRQLALAAGLLTVCAGVVPSEAAPPLLRSNDAGRKPPPPTVRTSREASLISTDQVAACVVDPARELFIIHPSVVDDCFRTTWFGACPAPVLPATRGAWTFGRLAEGIFGTVNPAILHGEVMRWLNEWKFLKVVNGENVPARPNIQALVINPWLAASGGVQLDMKRAPFRLLAIVARLDLRQPPSGTAPTAGEGRFVFNLLNAAGNPTEYLLILEYGLDASTCAGIMTWANAWHNLGTVPFGPAYNAALQGVTDSFTLINGSPAKPNGSALNQARTDDFFLAAPWELREFTLQAAGGAVNSLLMSTVAQTPANARQNTVLLANYANVNTPAILAGTFVVPLNWAATPFRGGASTHNLNFRWDGPLPICSTIGNPNARHQLSLNTCNGCHGAETNTVFKHVQPRAVGVPSALSGFLTGIATVDMCGLPHNFSDIARRQTDLCALLAASCSEINEEPPITFVH